MPRPKPPEQLFPVTFRLTRNQIRKVQEMGGVEWLRQMISKTQKTHFGRSAIEYSRFIKQRNLAITADLRPNKDIAKTHALSVQHVRNIKRQYAIDKEIDYETDCRDKVQSTTDPSRQLGFTRPRDTRQHDDAVSRRA